MHFIAPAWALGVGTALMNKEGGSCLAGYCPYEMSTREEGYQARCNKMNPDDSTGCRLRIYQLGTCTYATRHTPPLKML
jgi:hypothetical protein